MTNTKSPLSFMHSFQDGFSIKLYSGTHNIAKHRLVNDSCIVQSSMTIELIIFPSLCLIWQCLYSEDQPKRYTPYQPSDCLFYSCLVQRDAMYDRNDHMPSYPCNYYDCKKIECYSCTSKPFRIDFTLDIENIRYVDVGQPVLGDVNVHMLD